MDPEPASTEAPPPKKGAQGRGASRWSLPHLPVLIGVIGLGAAITTGVTTQRRAEVRVNAEVQAIRAELKLVQRDVGDFRSRMENLRWEAAKVRGRALSATAEPERSWRREQARLFEALVEEVEKRTDENSFLAGCAEVAELCDRELVDAARGRLRRLPELKFPSEQVFETMRANTYARPLAQFSRQNPGFYRLLKEHEPEIARADFEDLRKALARVGPGAMTAQAMLGFDLFAAVAPPDDPLLADWQTLASAEDFFESPDEETLGRWRRAQAAVRAKDLPTAVAEMQAIARSTVRMRQPFRAAFGRAILRNKPDDVAEAYPFLQEAAAAGDKEARAWVSTQDVAAGRLAEARGWLEAQVAEGEAEAVGALLKIYATRSDTLRRDAARERGMLEKIVATREAPAEAAMLLARNYEEKPEEEGALAKALGFYLRAADAGHPPAWLEVARCSLEGKGTAVDPAGAAMWAGRAFAGGERERSVPMLLELMRRFPDRAATQIQSLFDVEHIAEPGGYTELQVHVGGVAQLQLELARYFDRKKMYADAARFYGNSGARNAEVQKRVAELTTAHACESCGGAGKVQTTPECAACAGSGRISCGVCSGRGYSMVPDVPACPTCAGAGGLVQEGRAVACATCTGTGKGKATVTRKPCPACSAGKVDCAACESGRLKVTSECPRCRGKGTRALVDG